MHYYLHNYIEDLRVQLPRKTSTLILFHQLLLQYYEVEEQEVHNTATCSVLQCDSISRQSKRMGTVERQLECQRVHACGVEATTTKVH